jgi:integrase
LGKYPVIGLGAVREEAARARALVAKGEHPLQHRRAAEAAKVAEAKSSLGAVTEDWLKIMKASWRPKTYAQATSIIGRYVTSNKELSERPIRSVSPQHLRQLLVSVAQRSELCNGQRKHAAVTVARLLRSWLRNIFEFAIQRELVDIDPTYSLRRLQELRRPPNAIRHNKRLTPAELKIVVAKIRVMRGLRQTAIAVELLLRLFVRTGELRAALWKEFDLEEGLWRIPSSRMKAGKQHTVPLSTQAIALLAELRVLTGATGMLFPNQRRPKDFMCSTTVNRALERAGLNGPGTIGLSAHGFRGTASTLLHEQGHKSEWIEAQLAHAPRNSVTAAYNSAQYLGPRTQMMQGWSDQIDEIGRP